LAGESEYGAAMKVYALYGAFYKEVAKELGEKRTLELHRRANENMGIKTGITLSQQSATTFDLESLAKTLQMSNQSMGIECELIKGEDSLTLRNLRCPMYDGYRSGGLDDKQAESLCRVGAPAKLGTTLRLLNVDAVYSLRHYRVRPDERCVEEVSLTHR